MFTTSAIIQSVAATVVATVAATDHVDDHAVYLQRQRTSTMYETAASNSRLIPAKLLHRSCAIRSRYTALYPLRRTIRYVVRTVPRPHPALAAADAASENVWQATRAWMPSIIERRSSPRSILLNLPSSLHLTTHVVTNPRFSRLAATRRLGWVERLLLQSTAITNVKKICSFRCFLISHYYTPVKLLVILRVELATLTIRFWFLGNSSGKVYIYLHFSS